LPHPSSREAEGERDIDADVQSSMTKGLTWVEGVSFDGEERERG
jgi:hypothetical protein